MLDRVLGRASLKERIAELESERESLEAQLEAEADRRKDAVRDRQAAEERVNRLEDRIAELEDRVERAERDETDLTFRDRRSLRGDRLNRVLDRLSSVETGPEAALTAMVTDSVPDPVREVLGDRSALVDRAAPALVLVDDEQLVSVALRPPIAPEPFLAWDDGFEIDRAWFRPRGRYALALVRADLFAMGTYQGDERVDFTGFESEVRADHSKGGFSQARFERRRDEQIDAHVERAREAIETAAAEAVYVVGEKSLLAEFDDLATAVQPVGATGKPEAALGAAADEFWTTSLYLL